jgi:hypothetical protein
MTRRISVSSHIIMADWHKVAGKELIVLSTDVHQTFPDDLVAIGISCIRDQGEYLCAFRMLVYRAEMVVSKHDGKRSRRDRVPHRFQPGRGELRGIRLQKGLDGIDIVPHALFFWRQTLSAEFVL